MDLVSVLSTVIPGLDPGIPLKEALRL